MAFGAEIRRGSAGRSEEPLFQGEKERGRKELASTLGSKGKGELQGRRRRASEQVFGPLFISFPFKSHPKVDEKHHPRLEIEVIRKDVSCRWVPESAHDVLPRHQVGRDEAKGSVACEVHLMPSKKHIRSLKRHISRL